MWSGGRFRRSIAVAGGLTGLLGNATGQTPLCNGQHPGNPELISGTASCVYNEAGGVGQTLIDLSDASVIRWNNLGLSHPESILSFQWSGGPGTNPTVINRVEGGPGARHVAGTLEFQGGNLVVTNPNSPAIISGTVAARSILFATHRLDPIMEQALLNGQPVDFTGASHPLNVIDGHVTATNGDVVLAGRAVTISGMDDPSDTASEIISQGASVRIFGGQNFRLLPGGQERLQSLPGSAIGSVQNSKTIRAAQSVEIAASNSIDNSGVINANAARGNLYLRIDDGAGNIINNGILFGNVVSSQEPTGSGEIRQDTDDPVSPLSTGISRLRIPPRPGQDESKGRTVILFENAPVAGSASAQRDNPRSSTSGAARRNTALASNTAAPLAGSRSFFGLRGGSTAAQPEKKKKGR